MAKAKQDVTYVNRDQIVSVLGEQVAKAYQKFQDDTATAWKAFETTASGVVKPSAGKSIRFHRGNWGSLGISVTDATTTAKPAVDLAALGISVKRK